LTQAKTGFRTAIDAALLAAAVPVGPGERVLDLGCGVGSVGLCLLARQPTAQVVGIERHPETAALCRHNIIRNGRDEAHIVHTGDIRAASAILGERPFEQVVMNPPYWPAGRYQRARDAARAAALGETDTDLGDWLGIAYRHLKPKGWLSVIYPAARLDTLLGGLVGRFGATTTIPLWPKPGREAKRVIVRARKGAKTPARLLAGLVLHQEGGSYSAAAEQVLRTPVTLDTVLTGIGQEEPEV
jgi:tRNA1(Val) A37 N6-methylase TrmN6